MLNFCLSTALGGCDLIYVFYDWRFFCVPCVEACCILPIELSLMAAYDEVTSKGFILRQED
jgi:hypothetical protein